MKKMKLASLILAAVLGGALVTGCGDDGGSGGHKASGSAKRSSNTASRKHDANSSSNNAVSDENGIDYKASLDAVDKNYSEHLKYYDKTNDGHHSDKDGGIKIQGSKENERFVVIPAEIDGVPVTEIAEKAFYEDKYIEAVRIECAPVYLRNDIFDTASFLAYVELPEGLEEIGTDMFTFCKSLKTIELPQSLKQISYSAFSYSGITEITIPKNVELIQKRAFENSALETITFENADCEIEQYDKELTFPEDVTIMAPKGGTVEARAKELGYRFKATN